MAREDFNDVQELRNKSLGVLGGEGADFLEQTRTETTPAGIDTKCVCGSCGRPAVVTVEYAEAITGGEGMMPEHWQHDPSSGSIYPVVGCVNCRYELKLLFTPRELKALVQKAVAEGFVNGPAAQAKSLQVQAQRAAYGRR